MATPLYISLEFSLDLIAAVSELVGFFATVTGALIGGVVTARFGARHALCVRVAPVRRQPVLCAADCRQASARLSCAMCHCRKHNGRNSKVSLGLSLRSVLARLHRDPVRPFLARFGWPHTGGILGRRVLAERLGWVRFFLLATVVTVPALVLLIWIGPQDNLRTDQLDRAVEPTDNTSGDPNRRSPSEEPS